MDIDLENKVKEAIELLKQLSIDNIDLNEMDPVAKMLLVATLNEAQKIQDHVDNMSHLIVEKYCSDFIPHDKISAIPAIAIIEPSFKPKKDPELINIGAGALFSSSIGLEGIKRWNRISRKSKRSAKRGFSAASSPPAR